MDANGFIALCYGLAITLVTLMAGYAFVMGYILRRKISDTEDFITARGQVGAPPRLPSHACRHRARCTQADVFRTENPPCYFAAQVGPFRIGWSFFAGAVGAWVIASPSSYAATAGMMGLVFYALSSGLPFLMIAYAGDIIRVRTRGAWPLTAPPWAWALAASAPAGGGRRDFWPAGRRDPLR
jgi:hypothetical protein